MITSDRIMSELDQTIYKAIAVENSSRIKFFLDKKDEMPYFKNVDPNLYKNRLDQLEKEIEAVSKRKFFVYNVPLLVMFN